MSNVDFSVIVSYCNSLVVSLKYIFTSGTATIENIIFMRSRVKYNDFALNNFFVVLSATNLHIYIFYLGVCWGV